MTAAFQQKLNEMFDTPKPSEVWICGHRFDVEFFDVCDMHSENLGEMIFNKSLIRLWAGMSEDLTKSVLLHEMFHAMYEFAGLTDQSTEEETVDRLATAHLALLRDPRNAVVVEYLTN